MKLPAITFRGGSEGKVQIGETILALVLIVSVVAVLSGLLVLASGDVARWVVTGIAWLKGVTLDAESYGLPRSVLWENQLRRLAPVVSAGGAAACLCAMMVFVLRRVRNLWTGLARGLVFSGGFYLALQGIPSIKLPFGNPLGIVGPFEELRQNPGDSILQFLLILLAPLTAVIFFDVVRGRKTRPSGFIAIPSVALRPALRVLLLLAAAALVLLVAGDNYAWHTQVPLDTFHEGESLAPAVRWEAGQAPYRDFVIVHGPFQDPLRSVLAFIVFGRSIAATRTLESLLEIAALCLFALLIFQVFEWNIEKSSLATTGLFLFAGSKPFGVGFLLPHRDIMLLLFLLSMISLYRSLRRDPRDICGIRTLGLLFLASALPLASFAYSVDRGVYMSTGALLTLPLLYWSVMKRFDGRCIVAAGGGVAVGVCCIGLSIRWAFPDFLSHVFVTLPQIHGLGFSLPYPFRSTPGIVPVVLTAFNLAWVGSSLAAHSLRVRSFRTGGREFARNHFVEILLLVLGALSYLSALGRADLAHIYYSGGAVFLLTAVILLRHSGGRILTQWSVEHGVRYGLGLVMVATTVILYLIPAVHSSTWLRFPLGSPDEGAVSPNYRPAVAYLRDSLSTRTPFLTLTSEGVWEYLIGRPSATRFPILVYALSRRYQEEVIQEMETERVEYVLYGNNAGSNVIDGIPLEKRMPRVMEYVREKYAPFREFEDQQLWRRKGDWR